MEVFQSIRDRVWSLMSGWKESFLSYAGREVFIKSVAETIPTYPMTCFLLPNTLIKELESIIARFWWGNNAENAKIHWIAWNR